MLDEEDEGTGVLDGVAELLDGVTTALDEDTTREDDEEAGVLKELGGEAELEIWLLDDDDEDTARDDEDTTREDEAISELVTWLDDEETALVTWLDVEAIGVLVTWLDDDEVILVDEVDMTVLERTVDDMTVLERTVDDMTVLERTVELLGLPSQSPYSGLQLATPHHADGGSDPPALPPQYP
jgi:hypothetical protein